MGRLFILRVSCWPRPNSSPCILVTWDTSYEEKDNTEMELNWSNRHIILCPHCHRLFHLARPVTEVPGIKVLIID
jgi:hypothetical protein